jgi:hypothetical protein
MDTFDLMKKLIESRKRTKESLLQYSDVFLMADRIEPEQYAELAELINTNYQVA